MTLQSRKIGSIAAVLLAISVTGCINVSPTPSYIGTGDLVNVGLGGIKRNSHGTTLTVADLTATITSDADGIVRPVHKRVTYRAFPDYTSEYARNSLDRNMDYYSELNPYDGQWWVTLQLTTPGSTTNALPLPSGMATISVTSAGLINKFGTLAEGDTTNYRIELAPDPGNPSMAIVKTPSGSATEPYQFSAMRPTPTLRISSDLPPAASTVVGGMQIKLDYDPATLRHNPSPEATFYADVAPRLVPISHDPNISIIQHTQVNSANSHSLIAMVTNPNGFVDFDEPGWTVGQSTFKDLEFAVILSDDDKLTVNAATRYQLDATAGTNFYVDINGAVLGSISPVLTVDYVP